MAKVNTVFVSTHDLRVAGRLRDAFQDTEEHEVLLVKGPDDLRGANDGHLLILTARVEDGGLDGFLTEAAERRVPVFAMTSRAAGKRSEARQVGVDELIPWPPDPGDVVLLAQRTLRRQDLRRVTGIVGESDPMIGVLDRIVQIAEVDSTVLITGESGTGKELVARGIHHLSARRGRSFIPVNVAALTDSLLESELFGHEKGAFTGAIDTRKGFFELAHRGTIFLDEIGEMPPATQTKLLRVLEQREFTRVGGEKPLRVDVRIIAATHQDLRQMVALGDFRQDLYYRLNILNVDLPPLRNRREDIPVLALSFVEEVSQRTGREFPGISQEAMAILQAYDWPGNVRELRNLVESMVVLSPDRAVRPEDIPDEVRRGGDSVLLPSRVPRGGGAVRRDDSPQDGDPDGIRPELEFVFRTLVDLRVDLNDLREEFENYRHRLEGIEEDRDQRAYVIGTSDSRESPPEVRWEAPNEPRSLPSAEAGASVEKELDEAQVPRSHEPGSSEPDDAVIYRPGMTMEDLEREAIRLALEEVEGNRRKAAERLGIGERTLYRKIRRFGLEE